MAPLAKEYNEYYTVADWKNWQDNWELINGFPYCMSPSPTVHHQSINGNIIFQLLSKLQSCKKCKAYLPIDWIINEDTVVQPDVLVVCKEITTKNLTFPPILIFEILSPSTAKKDKTVKFDLYQEQGVKYYCMVDAETKAIELFLLVDGKYEKQNFDKNYTFELEDCKVDFDFGVI